MNQQEHFEHVLDQSLSLLAKGKSVSDILLLFPQYKDELQEYLELSQNIVNQKQDVENKKAFSQILQQIPEHSLSQKTQTQSYWYWIRENIFSHFSFLQNSMKYNRIFIPLALVLVVIFGTSAFFRTNSEKNLIDDWALNQSETENDQFSIKSSSGLKSSGQTAGSGYRANDTFGLSINTASPSVSAEAESSLGFSVSGAKDINNFRENIKNGYLPLPTDITYEGLFYDYYFDTNKKETCDKLFCPSYSTAISKDPISGKDEYYMAVGLNSNIKESEFQRKKLNLVVVLDISGSMESPFDSYYYDGGNGKENSSKTKMEIAKNVVADLTKHLKQDDRFGMVLFDDTAYMAKPLSLVGETDMNKIREHITQIQSNGGTNMTAGMQMGTDLLAEFKNNNTDEYENRIIFLTDAMPNTGDISRQGMMGQTEKNANEKIYSTFIGVGVDFNTDLIESITKIRGANYYSVHSEEEFQTRVDEQFEYMVTPLVFDLTLSLQSTGFQIEKVYGSPEADQSTGEIMKVNTLFPSKSTEGQTKGGIVLLKLKKISDNGDVKLKVSYEDRSGKKDTSEQNVKFEKNTEYFENTGIRKGILLSRYANLLKNWTLDERAVQAEKPYLWAEETTKPRVNDEMGIVVPIIPQRSEWERSSQPLSISPHYKKIFADFNTHFESEKNALGDNSLQQEIDLLTKLIQ